MVSSIVVYAAGLLLLAWEERRDLAILLAAVGGVALKTQAARRDGATVFLVPKAECADAEAHRPEGLRLIPVTTLAATIDSLRALEKGAKVPSC